MRRQLELWPPSQSPSLSPKIWKTLTDQQQKGITAALAELISKMVRSQDINQEENHER